MAIPTTPPSQLRSAAVLSAGRTPRRLCGLAVALAAGAILLVAAFLTPSAEGLGTHERLGLPPCGWVVLMDLPCPTCGMTTSFTHAADGNLLAAIRVQPLGAVIAVLTAMTFLLASYVAVTGSRVGSRIAMRFNGRVAWGAVTVALVAWGYKVMSYRGLL
jgi:hypothetical protein